MEISTLLPAAALVVMLIGGTFLIIMWAREESAKSLTAPFYERATPGDYRVVLESPGRRKSAVMRLVRQARPNVSLKEALGAVEHPPAVIAERISQADAEHLVALLTEKGARARVERVE
nr:ribosomal protein L7/L12 [Ardenticatena sp.]